MLNHLTRCIRPWCILNPRSSGKTFKVCELVNQIKYISWQYKPVQERKFPLIQSQSQRMRGPSLASDAKTPRQSCATRPLATTSTW